MKAVLYASKSTEDVHGSIDTQLEDCRRRAEREGWEVVDEFTDEAFSAYHGNRGPGLASAKALAVQAAPEHGRCILVAQDADRFARGAGDAPGAADHLGELYFAMRRQGVALWSDRSGELDPLRAVMEGERATDESARKSQSVTAGLKRRADSGKPVGAWCPSPPTPAARRPPRQESSARLRRSAQTRASRRSSSTASLRLSPAAAYRRYESSAPGAERAGRRGGARPPSPGRSDSRAASGPRHG